MTRYFRLTSFQLRTENFAAAPPSAVIAQPRYYVLLLRYWHLCAGVPWEAEYTLLQSSALFSASALLRLVLRLDSAPDLLRSLYMFLLLLVSAL